MKLRTNNKEYIAKPGEVEDIVKRFSKEMVKELGALVKSVVWFGSSVKGGFASGKRDMRQEILFGSDIDVLIVFDDLVNVVNPEVITAYRVITERVAADVSKRLHITTMALTKFWDYSLKGDPILINILRDGTSVFDVGCFNMAKKMLGSKKLKPSRDVVWIYLSRGPMSIANADWNVKQAVVDLHWAVVDAAHSALLKFDIVPDTPDYLVDLMKHHLVSKGVLHKRYISVVAEFLNIGRMVMAGDVRRITGDQYDRYRKDAKEFVGVVREVLAAK